MLLSCCRHYQWMIPNLAGSVSYEHLAARKNKNDNTEVKLLVTKNFVIG